MAISLVPRSCIPWSLPLFTPSSMQDDKPAMNWHYGEEMESTAVSKTPSVDDHVGCATY
jgi:hypothetical protein